MVQKVHGTEESEIFESSRFDKNNKDLFPSLDNKSMVRHDELIDALINTIDCSLPKFVHYKNMEPETVHGSKATIS